MIDGIITLLAFAGFLGICRWAYARHNREYFERAARLPLDEDRKLEPHQWEPRE